MKLRKLFFGLCAAALLAGLVGPAGPAGAQTDGLREALAKAYISNPRLEAERARLRAVDENVTQALSLSRPRATGNLTAGAGLFDSTTQFNSINDERVSAGADVEIRQPIYSGGTNPATVERSENEVLAARASLLDTEQQVFFDTGSVYTNVLRDKAIVDLRKNNETVLSQQLRATRDRFEVGEVTRTDVSQAEARLARATADRRSAEGDLASSLANFERLVGEPPGLLNEPAPLTGLPNNRQSAVSEGAVNNPIVIAATFNHLAATRNVRSISGELLPQVDVVGRAGHDITDINDNFNDSRAEALVQVRVPLYQSGSVRSRVRQAKQVASQRLVDIEDARRRAIETATSAWETLVATRATIEALRAEVRAQEIALEGVKQEALVGTRTVLDELDAEQELLNARVALVVARRDEFVATLGLAAAVGRLTAEPLGLNVPYYDVHRHYNEVRGRWFGTDVDATWQTAPNQ